MLAALCHPSLHVIHRLKAELLHNLHVIVQPYSDVHATAHIILV